MLFELSKGVWHDLFDSNPREMTLRINVESLCVHEANVIQIDLELFGSPSSLRKARLRLLALIDQQSTFRLASAWKRLHRGGGLAGEGSLWAGPNDCPFDQV